MDWVVDATDSGAIAALRADFRSYLERHAEPGSDVDGAELAFSELVSNVARHAAGVAWVTVDWGGLRPVITVHDLGPGFELASFEDDPPAVTEHGGVGLFVASQVAEQLHVAAKRGGGTRVSAVLPVARPAQEDFDYVGTAGAGVLPRPEEAQPGGTFGKEAFLRALVVQLGEAVELHQGPAAAEAAVAWVGAAVGGRMEEAYRAARAIVGRMDHDQIGDLYVQLKAAIDGGFRVVEASEERIVLLNTRCPFGAVVRNAPGLCRMTSSVFGGIAARNSPSGEASVVLEERIAVGDPGCKIVVWLVEPPPEEAAIAHRYRAGSRPALAPQSAGEG
jgi:anti-sigma regulatory factor (Ser/Thr protein kinase)